MLVVATGLDDNGRTDKWDTAYGFIQC